MLYFQIEALPEIVKAVGNRCDVFFDGGVRNGSDAFKAVALGAKMVPFFTLLNLNNFGNKFLNSKYCNLSNYEMYN